MTAKIHRKLLLGLAALAVSLTAASVASAAEPQLEFVPGSVFAKAHAPQAAPPPFAFSGQGVFFGSGYETWANEFAEAGEATQAGGHPDFTASFGFVPNGGFSQPAETPKDVVFDTPAGAVGNPFSVPRCDSADYFLTFFGNCPTAGQVGVSGVRVGELGFLVPVYSIVPPPGESALVAFKTLVVTVSLFPEVRSEGDYGLRVAAREIFPGVKLEGNTLTLWGVPHDPVHDIHRIDRETGTWGGSTPGVPRPFLSAPTDCQTGPVTTRVRADSWEAPGRWIEETDVASEATGCEAVEFDPSLSARPTTNVADSPTGLEVDLHTPQNEGCASQAESEAEEEEMVEHDESVYDCGLATSHLKNTTVRLPAGLAINPSGANGLSSCTPSEVGLTTPLGVSPQHFTKDEPSCPDASRIGRVEVETPLLEEPMPGSIYIAKPYDNPFESLLAIYIVANDPERGLIVKLAGKVEADPVTGQLTATVENAPELPFEHFRLSFKQGPHATLRTPGCGDYMTNSSLTPYSAPSSPVSVSDSWTISGGECGQPNSPSFDAGTVSPLAGGYSPFVLHLRRDDGSQNFHSITLSPPPGLVAKLAGVATCSDADLAAAEGKSGRDEQAHPSCPADSQIGHVVAGAGAGPSPYYAKGDVYMAGPYKGAPLSMAIVTPAVAGPFDLGTIVVRTALHVDPATAQITAVSDPIPDHLTVAGDGFPLDVRSIDLTLDRSEFVKTGTSCDPTSVDAKLTSTLGPVADLSSRFQLAECTNLGFKPQIALFLKGATKRTGHPRLTAVLKTRPGDANISYLQLAMPRSEFLDQAHIRTVCTRVQYGADACPGGAVYGHAWVTTPILDYTLGGNVLLRSSDNTLPDLVPDLRGPSYQPIRIESAGKTDSVHGAIRNTFEFIPDAPFSKLVTRLQGGKKGLLVNSRNICAKPYRAKVLFKAHNGRTFVAHPKVHARCGRRRHRRHRRHHHGRAHRSAVAHGSAVR